MIVRRKPWSNRSLTLFVILAMSAFVGTCSVTAQPKRGGTLNIILKPEPPHLEGALSTADPVWEVTSKFHNGLLNYDPDLKPVPELAESWQVSPDGRTITFKLRRSVKFHDGHDFTSADVKFTMEEVIKKYHPRGRTVFEKLEEVQTPDPYTAVFRFSVPAPYVMLALNASETPMLPKHIRLIAPTCTDMCDLFNAPVMKSQTAKSPSSVPAASKISSPQRSAASDLT